MKKIGVIFGGKSSEHNVSIMSGIFVSKNIDKEKYSVTNIYIDKNGIWHECKQDVSEKKFEENIETVDQITNVCEYLKKFDCIFPVLHGKYGEDGTIQGMLEILNIPYVGCKTLSSSIAMDKAYTKVIFKQANLPQLKYLYIRKNKDKYIYVDENFDEYNYSLNEIINKISEKLKYPLFIKPSNCGSSIGISKATTKEELKKGIEEAQQFDEKIVIEEGKKVRELECAVLGNEDITTSCVGEVISSDDFYDYNSKYKSNTSKIIMHADIEENIEKRIQSMAKKAFKSIDGKGLARVDFFMDENKNIYINEINTMPGFTSISMYPKLFAEIGIDNQELVKNLIELAFK